MNKQTRGFLGDVPQSGNTPRQENASFREQLNCHLPLIERQCFNAVKQQLSTAGIGNPELSHPVNIENEALELSNHVIDSLRKDDFKVLRQFKGNSKLSTYITSIVARQAVDMVRKKRGRSREKERAQKLGDLGMRIYEEMFVQGGTPEQVQTRLKDEQGVTVSLEEISQTADRIKSKKLEMPADDALVHDAAVAPADDDQRFIIADKHGDPSQLLEDRQRDMKIKEVLDTIVRGLNGEERLILRMRFPVTGEKLQKVNVIAKTLGITEKAAYKRITRVLNKCKHVLELQGVSLNEIL